jgi:hypothetical protein
MGLGVFENWVLSTFGLKRDEIAREKCIMKSFISCTLSPNITRMIKSRMRCAGHLHPRGRVLVGNQKESEH